MKITVPVPEGYNAETAKRGDLARSIKPEFIDYVRSLGFPYHIFDYEEYKKLFRSLVDFDEESILTEDKIIKKCSRYSKLASVYFPQLFDVKVPGKKTAKESFFDNKQLSIALELASDRGRREVSPAGLRGTLGFANGSQTVSNFRPEVAKLIYNRFALNGSVYDYSMGWGGRLTGFLASTSVSYVGVDVAECNFSGYDNILETYSIGNKYVETIMCPAEEFKKTDTQFDLAFSSPPYFAKEEYSSDENQSYKRYKKLDSWVDGFLKPTISNIYSMLKCNGTFGINIADIKINGKEHPLVSITKQVALDNNFKELETWYYDIPRTPGQGIKHSAEPIMFFTKEV